MLKYKLLLDESILIVNPEVPLETNDFAELNRAINPYLEEVEKLQGLMIYTELFSGWDNFAAFLSHVKFTTEHHQKIQKVADVTDSGFLSTMPRVASHFVQAEIRHFALDEKDAALYWLKSERA